MKKILIVEDDVSIAEIERDFLEIDGFETKIVTDGIDGLNEAASNQYDLILLDLMLPGMNGYQICKNVRSVIDVPIIMVTAKIEDIDKVRGLGIGADDYITKPFSPTELVARVKSNLAQYERLTEKGREKAETIKIGAIELNQQTRRVFKKDEEVELKNKEYELLHFFMTNPDVVFNKETLYDRIWGMDSNGDIKTVAVHINRLRDKLEKDPSNPVYIQTVWGAGYRFRVW